MAAPPPLHDIAMPPYYAGYGWFTIIAATMTLLHTGAERYATLLLLPALCDIKILHYFTPKMLLPLPQRQRIRAARCYAQRWIRYCYYC